MQDFLNNLLKRFNDPKEFFINLGISIGIILLVYLIEKAVLKFVHSKTENEKSFNRTRTGISYILRFAAGILIISIWFNDVESIGFIVAILIALFSLSMKDLILNIAGWIYIMVKSPFVLNDRIEIDGVNGDVVKTEIFHFTLMEVSNWYSEYLPTGRFVLIPNKMIFEKNLYNFNKDFPYNWRQLEYRLTLRSNWRKALDLLQEIGDENFKEFAKEYFADEEEMTQTFEQFELFDGSPKPMVRMTVNGPSIQVNLRYITHFKEMTKMDQIYNMAVIEAFEKEDDIEFYTPVMRVNETEYSGEIANTRPMYKSYTMK